MEGRCEPLRPPAGTRFAASMWLEPVDWGVAGARGPLGDAMPVGGTSEALLAFGSLPRGSRVARALVVLTPHPAGARVLTSTELVAERVGAFRGGPLPARHAPTPTDVAAARRQVPEGPARRVRLDVTRVAREAADGRLFLLLRTRGDGDLLFASPWAEDGGVRPRLELMVR